MKINVNKKTSVIILVSLFLIVVSIFWLSIYAYRYFTSPVDIGEYQELLDVCEVESGKTLNVTCTSLLTHYEDRGDLGHDFYLTIITPEDDFKNFEYTLKDSTFENEGVDFSNRDFDSAVPIYVNFLFERKGLGGYSLKKVVNSRIPDDVLHTITMGLFNKRKPLPHIESEEELAIESKGYYTSDPLEISENMSFGRVVLFNGAINEVVIANNDELFVDIDFEIDGEAYSATLQTNNLVIDNEIYSDEKLLEYEFDEDNQLGFLYLDKESAVEEDSLKSFCNQNDLTIRDVAFCNNALGSDLEEIQIINFETYLEDSLQNSKNKVVNLDKLILTYLLPK